jgi:hypothetical protein
MTLSAAGIFIARLMKKSSSFVSIREHSWTKFFFRGVGVHHGHRRDWQADRPLMAGQA